MIEAILSVSVCKKKQCRKLYGLFYWRMAEHPEYFSKNDYIKQAYIFTLKLVRYFSHILTTSSLYLTL